MTQLEQLIDDLMTKVRDIFAADGELTHPWWLLENESGERGLVVTPMAANAKDMVAEAMRDFVRGQSRYAMAMEAWFATHQADDVPPSERADRSEGVLVCGEDRNGESRGLMMEIKRKDGVATLGKPEVFQGLIGRFMLFDHGKPN